MQNCFKFFYFKKNVKVEMFAYVLFLKKKYSIRNRFRSLDSIKILYEITKLNREDKKCSK
jgi:hypothetical protein